MADFSEKHLQDVWNKGTVVDTYDSSKYRKDLAGAWIQRDQYGEKGILGWTIDHVYPESKGGNENLNNLRPMQWENNLSKSDDYPSYKTVITSDGNKNIKSEQSFTVNDTLQSTLKSLFNIK